MKNVLEGCLAWIIPFLLPGLVLWGIMLVGGVSTTSTSRSDPSGEDGSAGASAPPRLSECRAVGVVSPFDCPPCIESVAGELQRLAFGERWRGKIILFVAGDSAGASRFIRRMKRRYALAYPLLPLDAGSASALDGVFRNESSVVMFFGPDHLLERVITIGPETLLPFSSLVDSLLTRPPTR